MAFKLGNHYIDEILYGVAQDDNDNLKYALDQLSGASIEISAESSDIVDKKGNVIRTSYRTKTGTFTATNALLHPAALNAQSGKEITYASASAAIQMPKIYIVEAGKAIQIPDLKTGTLRVIGLYGNGANAPALSAADSAALVTGTGSNAIFTAPEAGADQPIQYLVKYERDVVSGAMLSNTTKDLPGLVKLTLFCAYGDPCNNDLKPCYVVIPRFAADPSMTISLDAETQEVDFSGNLNVDYCAGTQSLYYIYYPEEDLVISGVAAA